MRDLPVCNAIRIFHIPHVVCPASFRTCRAGLVRARLLRSSTRPRMLSGCFGRPRTHTIPLRPSRWKPWRPKTRCPSFIWLSRCPCQIPLYARWNAYTSVSFLSRRGRAASFIRLCSRLARVRYAQENFASLAPVVPGAGRASPRST